MRQLKKSMLRVISFTLSFFTMISVIVCDSYAMTLSPFENDEEMIVCNYEVESECITVNFNKIGIYSVYTKDKLLNTYNLVKTISCSNALNIEGLKPAEKYTFYVFKGNSPDDVNFISTIEFNTKPHTPEFRSIDASYNKIIISWDYYNLATNCYELFRSTDGKNFQLLNKITESDKDGFCYIDNDVKENTVYYYKLRACEVMSDKTLKGNFSKSVKTATTTKMGIPKNVSGKCKTYAYYDAVTCKSSKQYELLNSDKCYTDKKTGIRMIDDCYCIALGSFYGSNIGQKYVITLSTGEKFKAILCDQKSDRHTNKVTHQYSVKNKDIVEFYIDREYLPSQVDGDYSALPQFRGNVASIEKVNL